MLPRPTFSSALLAALAGLAFSLLPASNGTAATLWVSTYNGKIDTVNAAVRESFRLRDGVAVSGLSTRGKLKAAAFLLIHVREKP